MENENQTPVYQEYLVSDVKGTRKKIKIADVIVGILLLAFAVLDWVGLFLEVGGQGIADRFSSDLSSAIVRILVYGVPGIVGLLAIILGLAGKRRVVLSIYFIGFAIVLGAYFYSTLSGCIKANQFGATDIIWLSLQGVCALALLVAFVLSLFKKRGLGGHALALGFGYLGLLMVVYLALVSVYYDGQYLFEGDGSLHLIFYFVCSIVYFLAVPGLFVTMALRLVDRGNNCMVVEPIIVEKKEIQVVAPRKKVIWVGRKQD